MKTTFTVAGLAFILASGATAEDEVQPRPVEEAPAVQPAQEEAEIPRVEPVPETPPPARVGPPPRRVPDRRFGPARQALPEPPPLPGPAQLPRTDPTFWRTFPPLSGLQRHNIAILMNDLNVLRVAQITPAMRHQFQTSLLSGVESASRPSDYAIIRVVNDLSVAWFMTRMLAEDQTRFATNLNWILNSARLTQQQAQFVLNDTRLLLQHSGMTAQDIQTLLNSLGAVIVELQQQELPGQVRPF